MTEQQPEALHIAGQLIEYIDGPAFHAPHWLVRDAAAELRRLHEHEVANNAWGEKTEWVQQTAQPHELGMHRADVLRQRIDRLHAISAQLLEALEGMLEMWEDDPSYGSDTADKGYAAIKAAKGEA